MGTQLNPTLERIQYLLDERKWSLYRLAKESDITYSSINSMFNKNTQPTISTLEKICDGFGITISDFFDDSPEKFAKICSQAEIELLTIFRSLSTQEQELLLAYIKGFARQKL